MPKIPTFTAEARPTAEVASIKANIQIPLSQTLGNALSPITKAITEHRVQEKNFENKTEALKLENEALLEFTDTLQRASRLDNKDQAFELVRSESERIKNTFGSRASNKIVQTTFNNNFLSEVQKGIFKVDTRVSGNIIQSLDNQVSVKKNRLLTQAYLDKDPLAFQLIGSELQKLYEENFKGRIDVDQYDKLIQGIPSELETFEANQLITDNPEQALKDLRNKDKFSNLSLDKRIELERDALDALKPKLKENMQNYLVALEDGKTIPLNQDSIKEVYGNEVYNNFKQTEKNVINFSGYKNQLFNSKVGDETKIINSFPVTNENYAEDLKYKQKLTNYLSVKDELIKKDSASLILSYNDEVKKSYQDFTSETNEQVKDQKFKKYLNMTVESQMNMGIDASLIKVIPESQAAQLVNDYNNKNANEKISYLRSLEEQYGEYYDTILTQLSANGLPVTAKLVSYLGDEKFALSSISIDTKEEKQRLKNYLQTTDTTMSEVQKSVGDELETFRQKVLYANPFNTSKANKELDQITDIITYMTINELSRGSELGDAVDFATGFITNNFDLSEETYFIPKIYNNSRISEAQINFIKKKADVIQERYLDKFDMEYFKSNNPDVPEQELNESMIDQAKKNGVWLNSADGSGLVFAIKFFDGTFGIVTNKEGKELKFNFDDDSYILPHTNIILDFERPKSLEEKIGGA